MASLMDTYWGGGRAAAGDRMREGYDAAIGRLDPYARGGQEDYNRYRSSVGREMNQLDSYGDPAAWMYESIGQSPQDFYQSMMSGYNESPQAQYERQKMFEILSNGASASGLLGSGAYFNDLMDRTYDIGARDQDRYFGNVMSGNERQLRYLDDLRRRQTENRTRMSGLADLGYRSADRQGEYDVDRGKALAGRELGLAEGRRGFAGDVASLIGSFI